MRLRKALGKQDFKWSDTGDFVIESGDIADTRGLVGLGFMEEVQRRIKTSFGDWKLKEDQGANLHTFLERLNIERTWTEISDAISYSLTSDFFLGPTDFTVYVAPIGTYEVAVRLEFSDNIRRQIDIKLDSLKIVYNLTGDDLYITR